MYRRIELWDGWREVMPRHTLPGGYKQSCVSCRSDGLAYRSGHAATKATHSTLGCGVIHLLPPALSVMRKESPPSVSNRSESLLNDHPCNQQRLVSSTVRHAYCHPDPGRMRGPMWTYTHDQWL